MLRVGLNEAAGCPAYLALSAEHPAAALEAGSGSLHILLA